MQKTITIDGERIHDIPSLYEEINRVFMANEAWKLGQSLDALNDMLYGAYGEARGDDPIELIWLNIDKNKEDLGLETTKAFYENKLEHPETYNIDLAKKNLSDLENGTGQTYFEIVMEIIADHPNIKLVTRSSPPHGHAH